MIKKFKAYNRKKGLSGNFTLQEILKKRIVIEDSDIILQYLGYQDKNKRDIFEGDAIELKITDELMRNHFSETNFGQYIKSNPEITSIILVHQIQREAINGYDVYIKTNNEFSYDNRKRPKSFTSNEGITFPKFLVNHGAKYIGNIIENPYLIKRKPEFNKKDLFLYEDKTLIVIEKDKDILKAQDLYNGRTIDYEIKDMDLGDVDIFGPIKLSQYLDMAKAFLWLNSNYDSIKDAVQDYEKKFGLSEEDKKYKELLDELDISINDKEDTFAEDF